MMKQSNIMFTNEELQSRTVARNLIHVSMKTWDSCAHFEAFNPSYIVTLISAGGQSIHLQKYDCFECLSPHKIAA
ncbi:MAG: hypothetical protein FWD05_10455 [Oscillospiraceae bacterium]|nr:hypothetical protein [Oscillospiraceae bacterium]